MSVTSEESVAHHAAEEFSTTELLRMIIEGKYADPIRCLQTLRGYFRDILVRLDLEHMILARDPANDDARRIHTLSDAYRSHVAPWPEGTPLLLGLGWQEDRVTQGETLVWNHEPHIGKIEDAISLLDEYIAKATESFERIPKKPIKVFKDLCIPIERTDWSPSARFSVGCCDTIGRRKSMEDAMSVHGCLMNQEYVDYYAVFDGHGGKEVADICAEQFHSKLSDSLARTRMNPRTSFVEAFRETNALCQNYPQTGATAAIALVLENEIWVANAGDARIVLGHRVEKAVRLTRDHKPNDKGERDRISALGGQVLNLLGCWRVQGVLAVSRAIGDTELSPYISATPHVESYPLTDDCLFLIIACDGLWDVVTDEEAVEAVQKQNSPLQAARYLNRLAFNRSSTDNISVAVVFLNKDKQQTP